MASDVFSRFAVVGVLSDAPTSEVLLAVDQRTHRRLAIKILRTAPDRERARAIVRLGRQLSDLDHPNLVAIPISWTTDNAPAIARRTAI
jgi:hypothetical protein